MCPIIKSPRIMLPLKFLTTFKLSYKISYNYVTIFQIFFAQMCDIIIGHTVHNTLRVKKILMCTYLYHYAVNDLNLNEINWQKILYFQWKFPLGWKNCTLGMSFVKISLNWKCISVREYRFIYNFHGLCSR